MKTHIRIHPGLSQDKVRHLLDDHFVKQRIVSSWEGKAMGNNYVSVELTHDDDLSDDAFAKLGDIGTPIIRG